MAKKSFPSRNKQNLTPKITRGKIADVNDTLRQHAKQKGFTAYGLAKALQSAGGKMTEQAVRNFLNGGGVRVQNLGPLMAVLGLELRSKE